MAQRILVVDDDKSIVKVVRGYLEQAGYQVLTAADGETALHVLRRERPEARVTRFQFKAVRPTYDLHALRVNGQLQTDGKTVKLWAQDHEGWLTMDAVATLR